MNVLQPHHQTDEAARIAKVRNGLLIVPVCGSRFADFPRDLRVHGLMACIASAVITVSAIAAVLRFVAVP